MRESESGDGLRESPLGRSEVVSQARGGPAIAGEGCRGLVDGGTDHLRRGAAPRAPDGDEVLGTQDPRNLIVG